MLSSFLSSFFLPFFLPSFLLVSPVLSCAKAKLTAPMASVRPSIMLMIFFIVYISPKDYVDDLTPSRQPP